jgi:HD-GYP domain-containing protein (c-di-GMP phosphodiesterase class II)
MAIRRNLAAKFLLTVGTVVAATIVLLFTYIAGVSERAVIGQVDEQSRALLQQMVVTRSWISDRGGVYVKKAPGVEESPFLPGTTVRDAAGREYVFHNPAYVTRLLSEYAQRREHYRLHLASLKPINPANVPDAFEKRALGDFEKRGYESSRDGAAAVVDENGKRFYQRVRPLRVDRSCLGCHAKQGYKEGEIRGALSVSIPMALADAHIRRGRAALALAGVSILAIVGVTLALLLRKVVLGPVAHLHDVAGRLMTGDYEARARVETGDELEDLARAYNAMTGHILDGYHSMVRTLSAALEARDPYTAGHVERVSKYAKAVAEEMGLEPRLIHQVAMGAILHDIGKIGVPDAVLRKPGALDDEEREQMRGHSARGKEILSSASGASPAMKDFVLHHHEQFDGKGYPHGLKGQDIPLGDRIIAVADAFDAMITDRPYRKGLSREAAIAELQKESGRQFDPLVVAAFLKVLGSEPAGGTGAA